MTQIEFMEKFQAEKGFYQVWGEYVTQRVVSEISKSESTNYFFKIKPEPRVKEINSLIAKAFFRAKRYVDPYNEITDKVGTRFVVLLNEDIHKVKAIVQNCVDWDASEDRNFEKERLEKPTLFEYQSVHFVVKNKDTISRNNLEIPIGTPCEIQIRTLLQHAYSELSHDIIYKPSVQVPPEVHRIFAQSMALIETTDKLFSEANRKVNDMALEERTFMNELTILYASFNVPQCVDKLNTFIFDAVHDIVQIQDLENVKEFVSARKWMKQAITCQYSSNLLYRQPIILLIYYLIECKQHTLLKYWPLPRNYLEPLFDDLGYSMP